MPFEKTKKVLAAQTFVGMAGPARKVGFSADSWETACRVTGRPLSGSTCTLSLNPIFSPAPLPYSPQCLRPKAASNRPQLHPRGVAAWLQGVGWGGYWGEGQPSCCSYQSLLSAP